MRKVFLEKNDITNEFVTSNTYSAWQGFWLLGYECVPFTWEQMDYLDITKETVVNGYIRAARRAFQILEVNEPAEVSIPDERLLQEDVKYEKYTLQFNHSRGQTYFSNVLRGGNMHIFPLILVRITYANLADKLKLYNLLYDIGQTPPFKETNFQNQLENFLKRHQKIDAFL